MSNTSAALASTQAVSPLSIRPPCCPGRKDRRSPRRRSAGAVRSGRGHACGAPVDPKRFRRGVSGVPTPCYGEVTEVGVGGNLRFVYADRRNGGPPRPPPPPSPG